jgi:hypothetical protein
MRSDYDAVIQEILETYDGALEPVLRERRAIFAKDDPAAIAEANRRYEDLAKDVEKLNGFVLYDGFRVVHERPRQMEPSRR